MREIERFTVQAADGRTWRFALLEGTNTYEHADGQVDHNPGAQSYESLDEPGRFYINRKNEVEFELIDFNSNAPNLIVKRI